MVLEIKLYIYIINMSLGNKNEKRQIRMIKIVINF